MASVHELHGPQRNHVLPGRLVTAIDNLKAMSMRSVLLWLIGIPSPNHSAASSLRSSFLTL
jgi:hypothetical protein